MSKVMDVLRTRFSQQLHDDLEGREKDDKIDWCNEMDKNFEKITGRSSHDAEQWADEVSKKELKDTLLKAVAMTVKEKKLAPVVFSPSKEELRKEEEEMMKMMTPASQMFRERSTGEFRTNRKTGGKFPVSESTFRPTFIKDLRPAKKKSEEK